jgi:hypothetical protein
LEFLIHSDVVGDSNMITIIEAHIESYAPNDHGIVYRFSDGGIGGRSIRGFDEAVQEVSRIKARNLEAGQGPSVSQSKPGLQASSRR